MNKWVAEFDLEDGDTMPEHMDLEYKGAKLDFHCRPKEPILDKIRADIAEYGSIWVEYKITDRRDKDIEQLVTDVLKQAKKQVLDVIDKYKAESEEDEK